MSCLFVAALWSPVGKGLTSWLSFVGVFFGVLSLSQMCPGRGWRRETSFVKLV